MSDLVIPFSTYDLYLDAGLGINIGFDAVYPPELGCLGFGGIGVAIPSGGILTDIIAAVTTAGRQFMARSIIDGTSFKITQMALGTYGYDMANPTQALEIDRDHPSLLNELFRKPIDIVEPATTIGTKAFTARFSASSFTGAVGEIGLIAEILSSPIPAEVGTEFLFAVAHQGLNTKTLHHVQTYRILVTI